MRTSATLSPSICGSVILFQPDDPLAPPAPVFDAPWQAQALALADTMVRTGHITAQDWGDTLGAALKAAAEAGAADTADTYYSAVVTALEQITEAQIGITSDARAARRSAWEDAYRRTPHGQPVEL